MLYLIHTYLYIETCLSKKKYTKSFITLPILTSPYNPLLAEKQFQAWVSKDIEIYISPSTFLEIKYSFLYISLGKQNTCFKAVICGIPVINLHGHLIRLSQDITQIQFNVLHFGKKTICYLSSNILTKLQSPQHHLVFYK